MRLRIGCFSAFFCILLCSSTFSQTVQELLKAKEASNEVYLPDEKAFAQKMDEAEARASRQPTSSINSAAETFSSSTSDLLKQVIEVQREMATTPVAPGSSVLTCKKAVFGNLLLEDDPVPVGSIMQFDGIACPPGWSKL